MEHGKLCGRYGIVGNFQGSEFRSLKPIRESFLCEIVSGRHVTSHNSHV